LAGNLLGVTISPPGPLGELERAVLEHVWAAGPADAKAVHRAVGARRQITLNTIQSTMDRLFKKGLLGREKVSHAFVYSAAVTREQYGTALVRSVVASVLGPGTEPMLSAFVDLAEREGGASLDRLEQLIAERRARRGCGP
jgi:predicted transcriptional regulator